MRLIDADVLKATFEEDGHLSGYIEEYIDSAPTIDAVPVVHGRWKWDGRFKACSECGTYIDWDNALGASHWHYCPNCGAKMDKEDTNALTKSDRGCSTCANDGYDMPQCRECTEHPGYPWYKRRDGGAE